VKAMPLFVFAARAYLQPLILLPMVWFMARLWRSSGIRMAEAYTVLLFAMALAAPLQLLAAYLPLTQAVMLPAYALQRGLGISFSH
ncbi:MAG TPA: hypothetical protein VFY12_04030, partial [Arenimonas sp.]|nr:hypothetical protein [Arenimonas sp.]